MLLFHSFFLSLISVFPFNLFPHFFHLFPNPVPISLGHHSQLFEQIRVHTDQDLPRYSRGHEGLAVLLHANMLKPSCYMISRPQLYRSVWLLLSPLQSWGVSLLGGGVRQEIRAHRRWVRERFKL